MILSPGRSAQTCPSRLLALSATNGTRLLQAAEPALRMNFRSRGHRQGQGYEIVPITNNAELYREGHAMHHCVGTYGYRVAMGDCYIFSLRKDGEREATIELIQSGGRVALGQVRGPCNNAVQKDVKLAARKWLRSQKTICLPSAQRAIQAIENPRQQLLLINLNWPVEQITPDIGVPDEEGVHAVATEVPVFPQNDCPTVAGGCAPDVAEVDDYDAAEIDYLLDVKEVEDFHLLTPKRLILGWLRMMAWMTRRKPGWRISPCLRTRNLTMKLLS
jgi:hypothetical protein